MKVLLSADWYEFKLRKELAEYVCNHPDEFEGLKYEIGKDFNVDILVNGYVNFYYSNDRNLRTNSNLIALCEKENFPEYVVVELPDNVTDWQLDISNADEGIPYERIIYVLDGKIHWLGACDAVSYKVFDA